MKYLNYLINIDYIKVIFCLSDIGYLNLIVAWFLCIVVFGLLWGSYLLFRFYIYFLVNHSILSNFVLNELDIKYKYIKPIYVIIEFILITILFLAVLFNFFLAIMFLLGPICLLTGNVIYCADALMDDGLPSLLANANYYDFYANDTPEEMQKAIDAITKREKKYLVFFKKYFLTVTNTPCYSIFDLRYEHFNQEGQKADLELFNNYITNIVRSEWQRCRLLERLNQGSVSVETPISKFIREYIIRSNINLDYSDITITN